MAIRCATAHSVVLYMKLGMTLEVALREAMTDLHALVDPYAGSMNIIGLDRDGNPNAASNTAGTTFVFMRDDMADYEERERIHVP